MATQRRLFAELSEAELAIAHFRPSADLQRVFRTEPISEYPHLDPAHLRRHPGDYCPFDCDQCNRLRDPGLYSRLVIRE
jgi:hypothetical protein